MQYFMTLVCTLHFLYRSITTVYFLSFKYYKQPLTIFVDHCLDAQLSTYLFPAVLVLLPVFCHRCKR